MISQQLCYFLIQSDEITGSSMSNNDFGAIYNFVKALWQRLTRCPDSMSNFYVQAQNSGSMPEFYVLEKIAQVQAQYLSFFVLKKIAQAQCSRSMFRLNVPYLSGIL